MTFNAVSTMVGSIGYPYAYYQFPEGTNQAAPFVCFMFTDSNDLMADNRNYQKIEHLVIELYTDTKNFTAEAAVESVLASNDMVWTREEEALDDERLYVCVYEMDVVITTEEETNNG